MSAIIIDGTAIAKQVLAEQKILADGLTAHGHTPGLAVLLVGDDPASAVYVRSKERACREAGVQTFDTRLPVDTSETELLKRVDALNSNPRVHGILVQLPLPQHINAVKILQSIVVEKDVDGFNWRNLGALLDGHPALAPCTPSGSMIGAGAQQHCRQTGCTDAAGAQCHSHCLPFPYWRSGSDDPASGYSALRNRQTQDDHRRHGQARCGDH